MSRQFWLAASVVICWGLLVLRATRQIEKHAYYSKVNPAIAAPAPPSCPRSKFCPCTPPRKCSECRCGGALPAPGTPLTTAVVHDGQARIAWIDDDGQRQERTMTEQEFHQFVADCHIAKIHAEINAKSK